MQVDRNFYFLYILAKRLQEFTFSELKEVQFTEAVVVCRQSCGDKPYYRVSCKQQ